MIPLGTYSPLRNHVRVIGNRWYNWHDLYVRSVCIYFRSTVIASSAVDHGTENLTSKTNDWYITISCFFAKYTEIRSKNTDLNGSESELCKADIIISSKFNLFFPRYSYRKNVHWALNNNPSFILFYVHTEPYMIAWFKYVYYCFLPN